MIVIKRLADGVLKITSNQGGVFAHNLSGDYVLPVGIVSVSESTGDDRQWYNVDIDSHEVEKLISRNKSGSANDELMWTVGGSKFWWVEAATLRTLGSSVPLPVNGAAQWRSGSASCDGVIQFVKGETATDTFVQQFNPHSGELGKGFWLKDVSGGRARKARNVVRYDHWDYGTGFLFSTQEDASHEHFCTTTGKSWHQFESNDANGAARWSHAATWGQTFIACRPYMGTIEQVRSVPVEGSIQTTIIQIVSQERLKELTGATYWPQWWHGSTNGEVVAFSVAEKNQFLGVYGLELSTLNTWKIHDAYDETIINSDFASMARPAITLDGRHVIWHERPGVVYVSPIRQTVEPEPDTLAERVERLERIIASIHAATLT